MKAPGEVSFRRVVVTNRKTLGKTIAEMGLDELYGVAVTRIVRAGLEMTAVPGIRLQFGDFLHVVGDSKGIEGAAKELGDSSKALNQTQFIPVFIGLVLGVLAGLVPMAVPGLSSPLEAWSGRRSAGGGYFAEPDWQDRAFALAYAVEHEHRVSRVRDLSVPRCGRSRRGAEIHRDNRKPRWHALGCRRGRRGDHSVAGRGDRGAEVAAAQLHRDLWTALWQHD